LLSAVTMPFPATLAACAFPELKVLLPVTSFVLLSEKLAVTASGCCAPTKDMLKLDGETLMPVKLGGGVLATVIETAAAVAVLPEVSRATAESVCAPFETVVVFQFSEYGVLVTSTPRFVPSSRNCTPAT